MAKNHLEDYGCLLPPQAKQSILNDFNQEKLRLGPGQNRSVAFTWVAEDGAPNKMVVPAAKVDECFEKALNLPLKVAEQHITRLSSLGDANRKVIVSGRSCRNRALRSAIADLCSKASLEPPIFATDKFQVNYE